MHSDRIEIFIVGAQKAGTTSLYDWLGSHPEICAPKEAKDYHFFTIDELYELGHGELESKYRGTRDLKVHCAVNYLYFSERASGRIYDYNPEAKIIICLRNPTDRALSAYKYFVRTLREPDSLCGALEKERQGLLSPSEMANRAYVGHGHYDRQVSDYLKRFTEARVFVVSFDDLIDQNERTQVMKRICGFLGVSDKFDFKYSHLNVSGKPRIMGLNYLLRKSRVTRFLGSFLPKRFRTRFARKLEQLNTSSQPIPVDISPDIRRWLAEYYRPVLENLESMTNFDVPSKWYD